jgi:hypothetical protein
MTILTAYREEIGAGRAFATSGPTNNAWRAHPVPDRIVASTRATPLRPSGEATGKGIDVGKPALSCSHCAQAHGTLCAPLDEGEGAATAIAIRIATATRPANRSLCYHELWPARNPVRCVEKSSPVRTNFPRAAGALCVLRRGEPLRLERIHSAAFPHTLTGHRQPKSAINQLAFVRILLSRKSSGQAKRVRITPSSGYKCGRSDAARSRRRARSDHSRAAAVEPSFQGAGAKRRRTRIPSLGRGAALRGPRPTKQRPFCARQRNGHRSFIDSASSSENNQ